MLRIREELGDCQRCKLASGRRNLVFGVGNPAAELLLVGEAPGRQEDETGEPFVGRSGRLLTRMLGTLGLERRDVYICNVIKCRPPGNRDPEPDEVAACSPFVHRQIQTVAPKVILALGRFAARTVIDVDAPLSRLRGRDASYHHIPIVATYHPSFLLRTPVMKREAWRDLLRVRRLLAAAPAG
ncbi:MAG: uracil-DNA glycosylase [Deltaproteobacteria bacterium]|nr:uracil-DNA glycosylase [Deltaproteobacteria bacterium]